MVEFSHIGKGVCCINSMAWGPEGYPEAKIELKNLAKGLKETKYKYLMAVTANLFQKKSVKILAKNGFKKYSTFYSSHNDKEETLTIWFKIQKKFKDLINNKINLPERNCSVAYESEPFHRCSISTDKDLPPEFKKIKNTPIYFALNKKYLVNPPKEKKIKMKTLEGIWK